MAPRRPRHRGGVRRGTDPRHGGQASVSEQQANEPARIFELFRTMLLIREFDDVAGQRCLAGDIGGSVHQCIGQEAIAVGLCTNLRIDDLVSSNHRGHGHTIAKGPDPQKMMLELFGRAGGTSDGKGGSMHIADFSVGMLGANGVIADNCTIAVGAAQASRLLGLDRIVTVFIGDGGFNRGPFLESLNWARVYDLPVLFVCENNNVAASTTTSRVTGGPGMSARAESFGVPAHDVDGNDLLAVDALAARLVAEVRGGSGPQLIHAATYRLRGHYVHDPAAYRDPAQVEAAMRHEPIRRSADWLLANGMTQAELDAATSAASAAVAGYVAVADAAPWPDPALAYSDVQDIGAVAVGARS